MIAMESLFSLKSMKMKRRIGNMYCVIWVAGERDGELLGCFEKRNLAIDFAYNFLKKHEEEFDLICGGVAIIDEDGNVLQNW